MPSRLKVAARPRRAASKSGSAQTHRSRAAKWRGSEPPGAQARQRAMQRQDGWPLDGRERIRSLYERRQQAARHDEPGQQLLQFDGEVPAAGGGNALGCWAAIALTKKGQRGLPRMPGATTTTAPGGVVATMLLARTSSAAALVCDRRFRFGPSRLETRGSHSQNALSANHCREQTPAGYAENATRAHVRSRSWGGQQE